MCASAFTLWKNNSLTGKNNQQGTNPYTVHVKISAALETSYRLVSCRLVRRAFKAAGMAGKLVLFFILYKITSPVGGVEYVPL
jgi:hypothetical protein